MREVSNGVESREIEGNWMSFKGLVIYGFIRYIKNLVFFLSIVNYYWKRLGREVI